MVDHQRRIRLDDLLVQRGLVVSRSQARAFVLAGRVTVPGADHVKPGLMLRADADVSVSPAPSFVSRGGQKLAHALAAFDVDPQGRVAADIGASTGGFTDCLLQNGARRVYAIDVGYGQLDWRLRVDPRVVVMERTNARYLEGLPERVDLVVMDASFISFRLLLPVVGRITTDVADVIVLVKPQFEAGRGQVGRGGVVRDPIVHRDVLESCAASIGEFGLHLRGLTPSPIKGPAGNVEFLAHLRADSDEDADPSGLIATALDAVSLVA